MGAEQKISASVFTHRGDGFSANTNSFILDGRYPHEFELDSSHVSIANTDKSFFFAVCDTKQTDYLNESISGIKELRKLCTQFKSSARDIRARTEALGECLVETENLLYDTASYPDDIAAATARSSQRAPAATDKQAEAHRPGADEGDAEQGVSEDDENAGSGEAEFNEDAGDGEAEEGGDSMARQDAEESDELPEPGTKGFSGVGFIMNESKGSILAQGACTALLLRDGALRIVSGGARRGSRGDGIPAGYGGRASAVFEVRVDDVFLLCTTTILDAIGEESVDSYLAMQDDVSAISTTIIRDAIQADPSSNMTCMVVRVEENVEEEAANPLARRQQDYRYAQPAGARATQPTVPSTYLQQGEYAEQDPRMVQAPVRAPLHYPSSDVFARRATTRFQPPPRPLSFGGNRNLLISVGFTVGLVAIFLTSLYFFNKSQPTNAVTSSTTPTRSTSTTGYIQPSTSGSDEPFGGEGDGPYVDPSFDATTEPSDNVYFTTTPSTTTQPTTTEAPPQIHKVKTGETLSKIAQQYYNASRYYTLIKEANNLQSDLITIGQELIIPPKPTAEPAAGAGGGESEPASNVTAPRTSTQ